MDPRVPVDELGRIAYELGKINDRINDLTSPSGTMAYQTVEKLQALVENIQQQLDDYISTGAYTKAQVDNKVANPGIINPTAVHTTGSITADGNLTVDGFITLPGVMNHTNANFRTVTSGDYGEIGISSSSARYKQDIEDAALSEEVFQSIKARRFRYRSDVAKLGLDAPVDVGFIAEELVEAGITEPVFLDTEGRPEGINYDRLTPHLWIMVQQLLNDRDEDRRRIAALERGAA